MLRHPARRLPLIEAPRRDTLLLPAFVQIDDMNLLLIVAILICSLPLDSSAQRPRGDPMTPITVVPENAAEGFARAAQNGRLANEGFRRSQWMTEAWLEKADPSSGLLPRNLQSDQDIWNARDAAADLYPFLVLTAALTDRELYEGRMREILEAEIALTSRVGSLPDTYSFSRREFLDPEPDLDRVIFGASEYIKDGLLPITEWLGRSPWRTRMFSMLDDVWHHAPVETPHGRIPSTNPEVNGEMLQVLARAYWMTGERRYLDYALRLGDYYLLGGHHPTRDFETLRLRDHGNEIVSGLTELYAALRYAQPDRAARYEAPIHAMLDRILEVGRNEHGLFYNVIDPRSGEALDRGIADNFGYILNGFYTVYLLDGTGEYRRAARTALESLRGNYAHYDWERGSADGDADAIEGALNLYNRERVESAAEWIETQTRFMWSKQDSAHQDRGASFRGSGIVEGWHGDGNFARTALMFALWKTQGTSIRPWRPDVVYGAVRDGDRVLLSLSAEREWDGALLFDVPRHRDSMGLLIDYPRINQFPEWFSVERSRQYLVRDQLGRESIHTGADLARGIPLRLKPGQEIRLVVQPLDSQVSPDLEAR